MFEFNLKDNESIYNNFIKLIYRTKNKYLLYQNNIIIITLFD